MKKLFTFMAFCLAFCNGVWADDLEDGQVVEENDMEFFSAESSALELNSGDPMKKRWKYLVAHQDDLSTPEATNLKNWLNRTGNKQMNRGTILFWSSLAWPVIGGVVVSAIGVKDDNEGQRLAIAMGSVGLMGVQMTWGLIDQAKARKKLDQSRLIIVQAPVPGATFGNENCLAQLGIGLMRDNMTQSYGFGPSISVNF